MFGFTFQTLIIWINFPQTHFSEIERTNSKVDQKDKRFWAEKLWICCGYSSFISLTGSLFQIFSFRWFLVLLLDNLFFRIIVSNQSVGLNFLCSAAGHNLLYPRLRRIQFVQKPRSRLLIVSLSQSNSGVFSNSWKTYLATFARTKQLPV